MDYHKLIIIRGGGDLATGAIHRLTKAGFRVLVLETDRPSAIRRQVSFCEAVYDGQITIEGITAVHITSLDEITEVLDQGNIPVLVDPAGDSIRKLSPDIVVDAMIAKKNLGTHMDMAPMVIGLGPGFCAGKDVHVVIETKRGHNLGRIQWEGEAIPNTGIPGNIGGYAAERVIHAPIAGQIRNIAAIGDVVAKGQIIARISSFEDPSKEVEVPASINGILRGLIRDGYSFDKGFKIADIDPRISELKNCFTISDKARCIAGSVLEVVCSYFLT